MLTTDIQRILIQLCRQSAIPNCKYKLPRKQKKAFINSFNRRDYCYIMLRIQLNDNFIGKQLVLLDVYKSLCADGCNYPHLYTRIYNMSVTMCRLLQKNMPEVKVIAEKQSEDLYKISFKNIPGWMQNIAK